MAFLDALRLGVALALFLFASVYVGTGTTLVFFLYPIAPRLTPATYQLPFVQPVANATRFFTVMTSLMLFGAVGLIVLELGTAYWIAPAVYLVICITATLVTTKIMFKINGRMAAGITDPAELQATLKTWRGFNGLRASLWLVEWIAIATWFAVRVASGF